MTSLVLEAIESEDVVDRAREPRGGDQRLVWEVLKELSPEGQAVDVGAVVRMAAAAKAAPTDGKQDQRSKVATRALNALVAKGFAFFVRNGTQVTLTRAEQVIQEDFEEVGS